MLFFRVFLGGLMVKPEEFAECCCDFGLDGRADRFTLCVCFCVPLLFDAMRTLRSKLLLGNNIPDFSLEKNS